mmetsp:Transcript_27859/g.89696  ORF Transcript_27859/g.89696 Transcript_27859/m.89696 type:complete len:179 (-) Transcript_27859:79-615(-)
MDLSKRTVPWTEELEGVRYLVLPHPSGVSHFWNDEVSWHRAAGTFRAALKAVGLSAQPAVTVATTASASASVPGGLATNRSATSKTAVGCSSAGCEGGTHRRHRGRNGISCAVKGSSGLKAAAVVHSRFFLDAASGCGGEPSGPVADVDFEAAHPEDGEPFLELRGGPCMRIDLRHAR